MNRLVPITALALLLTACLNVPLLNYAKAAPQRAAPKGCALEFTKTGHCASIEWTREPSGEETGSFVLRFWDAATGTEHGPYVAPAPGVAAKLWMPSMGHGSSPIMVTPASGAGPGAGVYEATGVFFVMPGKWELWVELRSGRDVLDRAKVELER